MAENTPPATSQSSGLNRVSEIVEALANLSVVSEFKQQASEYVSKLFNDKTPPEKVKKRPDGFDYVESSWMDFQAKQFMPFYKYELLHTSYEKGFVNVMVSLTDKITGNVELGAGSSRIHVSNSDKTHVIDMSNNIKSALTNAIKNAQSRFGIAADVYQKREAVSSSAEKLRKDDLYKEIYTISPTRAKMFSEQWDSLGTDFTEYLDRWEIYVSRNSPPEGKAPSTDAPGDKPNEKASIL